MTHSTSSNGRSGGIGRRLLVAAVVLIAALVLVVSLASFRANSNWNNYLEELREKGEPFTISEILAQRPTLADEDNNIVQLQAAAAKHAKIDAAIPFEVKQKYQTHLFKLDGAPVTSRPKWKLATTKEYVALFSELLTDLRFLHEKPDGRLKIDYSQGAEMLVGESIVGLSDFRTLTKLLRIEGLLRLVDGNVDDASKDALLMLRLARPVAGEPMIIASLVQTAIVNHGVVLIEETISTGQMSRESLSALARELEHANASSSMKDTLRGERAIMASILDLVAQGKYDIATGTKKPKAGFTVPGLGSFCASNKSKLVELIDPLIESCDDHTKFVATAKTMDAEAAKMSAAHMFARMALPSLSRAAELHVTGIAKLRCMQVALAVEAFTLDHGKQPQSLDELTPKYMAKLPVDPFTAEPLKYTQEATGVKIYSVGLDATDDGGAIIRPKRGMAADTGVFIPRPDQRGFVLTDEPEPTFD